MKIILLSILLIYMSSLPALEIPTSKRFEKVYNRINTSLVEELDSRNLLLGSEIFIRIFKQEAELELWIENSDKQFVLYKTYPICHYSGELGPKQKEGDMQSPEGFYFVSAKQLNPWSQYHLSFNLGYPNQYERAKGYTGSALMVHGDCVSIGCYAMTDEYIEEIYSIAYAALKEGQPFFRVHAFPFRMTSDRMEAHDDSQWYTFWQNLKQGYDYFETRHKVPNVTVKHNKYYFN